ncbi:hypothetical protein BHE74_00027670 [Ensete ventricosum]|nr:hypothetical protein GW17_00040698 [Ensete ventricosum]RWW65061.1 hypothetical protein BHE74_00027670 [Ensete ventricosum]
MSTVRATVKGDIASPTAGRLDERRKKARAKQEISLGSSGQTSQVEEASSLHREDDSVTRPKRRKGDERMQQNASNLAPYLLLVLQL